VITVKSACVELEREGVIVRVDPLDTLRVRGGKELPARAWSSTGRSRSPTR
jgi:hypothetical protein